MMFHWIGSMELRRENMVWPLVFQPNTGGFSSASLAHWDDLGHWSRQQHLPLPSVSWCIHWKYVRSGSSAWFLAVYGVVDLPGSILINLYRMTHRKKTYDLSVGDFQVATQMAQPPIALTLGPSDSICVGKQLHHFHVAWLLQVSTIWRGVYVNVAHPKL